MTLLRSVLDQLPTGRRLLRIVWPFLAVVAMLLLLGIFSTQILSAVRAYVGGEGLWSKAQKDAVYYLNRYADTANEEDYRRFLDAMKIPLGDRKAREELEKPDPDLSIARQGFIEGRNQPDDIDAMIMLFRRFRNVSHIDRAIAIWQEADVHIADLLDAASELRLQVVTGWHDPYSVRPMLSRIEQINTRLTPLEDAFSSTLSIASRETQFALVAITGFAAACLVGLGIMLSRRMLLQSESLEHALRSSEERFQLAVNGSNDGLWDWNLVTHEMYYSPRAKELVGFTGDAFPNSFASFIELVHPDDRDSSIAAIKAHLRRDTPYDAEFRCRTQSGEYRWFRARGRTVRNAAGRAVRMAGSVSDITDRKQAEAQLFAEKERAQVTLESIGDAVITTDVHGWVEYLNPVAAHLTGWSAAEAQGRPVELVCRMLDEATREPLPDSVASVLHHGETGSVPPGVLLLRHDGTEIAIHRTAAPIRNRAGGITGAVLVLRDVHREREYATQLSYQASHDALTGLINRREFEHRLGLALTSAREASRHHAMLYLDLDQFKLVNDTSGHAAGDELMRQISLLLGGKLREGDTLARLGGDEFGVLLENCPATHAARIAENLRQTVANFHFVWHDRSFAIGVSIGLVNISDPSLTLADVLSAGDAACYMAKEKGRSRVHAYHPKDTELASRHGEMEWVARIRGALDADRFCLYSQEIVSVADPKLPATRFELLLRMVDERGQLVAPMAFIPAAERYNLMPSVDRWVVRAAFSRIASLGPQISRRHMYTINLSGTSIGDDGFLEFIRDEFRRSALPQGAVCLEITETAAIANLGKAAHFIAELRGLGCRISLDDFGAGMSSFRYLKHLPVDFIKIDGSFVLDMLHDPIDSAMVEAINRVGHVMEKKTVAEWVENRAILARLRAIGVDYAQGFGVSRPRPFVPALVPAVHPM